MLRGQARNKCSALPLIPHAKSLTVLMATQNYGLVRTSSGVASLQRVPIPKLRDDYILVRTCAVGLNPTDWTTLEAPGDCGTIVGCDYSGIVEQVGKGVIKPFKKGERIAGFAHGGNDANPQNGAFARYIAVKGDLQMHIPDGISFEEAASTGVGIGSAGYALYKILGLSFPSSTGASEDMKTILIYGGSTATGTIAIQLAKLSGWKVVTTASPQHYELLEDRGADVVYDYREPNIGARIRKDNDNTIQHTLDTVNHPSTAAICADAMSTDGGGMYCNLLGIDCPRDDVQSVFFLGYSMSGEAYIFESEKYAAQPEDFKFAREWYSIAEKLWAEGKWTNHPLRIMKKGLGGIGAGMQEMKEGKVKGMKLVYRVDDTNWPTP